MKHNKPTVALLNDTSLYNSHFGCQLVCQAFREQLTRAGLHLQVALPGSIDPAKMSHYLKAVDLVIVNGEGTIHHGRAPHLLRVAGAFPSVLVNCVYQENAAWPELKQFLLVAARESLSAQALSKDGADPIVVPDVMFASSFLNAFVPKAPPQNDLGITDNVTDPAAGFAPHVALVADYLNQLCSFKRLCIGRFHAAVAAMCLKIPFSTWDSNTWKIEGMMRDADLAHLHADTFQKARTRVPDLLDPRIDAYVRQARQRIVNMFDKISEIAHNQMHRNSANLQSG